MSEEHPTASNIKMDIPSQGWRSVERDQVYTNGGVLKEWIGNRLVCAVEIPTTSAAADPVSHPKDRSIL